MMFSIIVFVWENTGSGGVVEGCELCVGLSRARGR